ncbi:hypothetical protein MAM1_0017d01544 [Mucor ambiguus]|uniref:F-box domain-containing protein n=1 Tax=Mucor ambiguus TaxID=91626 RepID=A0A0C9M631_9FUNG|nr:hypothetical protein MAM1_0017d01544 [Mucor ambiguus]
MAANWNTLPVEIRLSVFNHVGDIQQLVESRFVRNAWGPLTEVVIFSQRLNFKDASALTGFTTIWPGSHS